MSRLQAARVSQAQVRWPCGACLARQMGLFSRRGRRAMQRQPLQGACKPAYRMYCTDDDMTSLQHLVACAGGLRRRPSTTANGAGAPGANGASRTPSIAPTPRAGTGTPGGMLMRPAAAAASAAVSVAAGTGKALMPGACTTLLHVCAWVLYCDAVAAWTSCHLSCKRRAHICMGFV